MDALQFEAMPNMRHPYLLLTYEGWSNAAGVATATGQFLIDHLQAERFASIDPEEFYSFAEQRPQARYNDAGEREIIWPQNDFYFCAQPQLEHDIIIATGIEPHLKWRTFTNLMIDFIKKCEVYQTVTLGALWADVLYSAPVPFSGSSTDPQLAERLGQKIGLRVVEVASIEAPRVAGEPKLRTFSAGWTILKAIVGEFFHPLPAPARAVQHASTMVAVPVVAEHGLIAIPVGQYEEYGAPLVADGERAA